MFRLYSHASVARPPKIKLSGKLSCRFSSTNHPAALTLSTGQRLYYSSSSSVFNSLQLNDAATRSRCASTAPYHRLLPDARPTQRGKSLAKNLWPYYITGYIKRIYSTYVFLEDSSVCSSIEFAFTYFTATLTTVGRNLFVNTSTVVGHSVLNQTYSRGFFYSESILACLIHLATSTATLQSACPECSPRYKVPMRIPQL